jgi:hypothetical protein
VSWLAIDQDIETVVLTLFSILIARRKFSQIMSANPGAEATERLATQGTSESTQNQRSSQQRGGDQGRFNGRGQDGAQKPQPKKFTDKEESLGDEFFFQHTDDRKTSDQHATTKAEITTWFSSMNFTSGADVECSLAAMPTVSIGVDNPGAELTVWKIRAQMGLQRTPELDSNMERAYGKECHGGPNLGSLKGKTVRGKNIMHVPSLVADVPYDIIKTHRNVTVCFDIMFVNKILFLITVSRNIRFGTTKRLLSRKADVAGKALLRVIRFYRQRGFRVKEGHGDGEFEPLRSDLADAHTQLNVTAEDEHVPEAERYIRTRLKERTRAVYNTLPFRKMSGMMIVEMVHSSNYWLNMFPANNGVSAVLSPRRIMTGQYSDYDLHCQLQIGEYVQVYESHDTSMESRTTGAIALRPPGNVQGGYFFMSLSSGKRLNRREWTLLPMPGEVIARGHALARHNPAGGDIQFRWRDGTAIEDTLDDGDDLHDKDYVPGNDNSDSEDDVPGDSDSDGDNGDDPEPPQVGGVEDYNNGQEEHIPDRR